MELEPTPAPPRSDDGAAVAAATVAAAGDKSPIRKVQLIYSKGGGGDSVRKKRGAVPRKSPASDTSKSPVKKSIRTRRSGAPSRRTGGGGAPPFNPIAAADNGPSPPSVVHPPGVPAAASASERGPATNLESKQGSHKNTGNASGATKPSTKPSAPKNTVKDNRKAVINGKIFKWSRPHIFGNTKVAIDDAEFEKWRKGFNWKLKNRFVMKHEIEDERQESLGIGCRSTRKDVDIVGNDAEWASWR